MQEDTQAIDDVIVVAYGTAKKEAFTGSASVMKADDIGKRQVSNISNALAGAVAGVPAVSSNGQPGEIARSVSVVSAPCRRAVLRSISWTGPLTTGRSRS